MSEMFKNKQVIAIIVLLIATIGLGFTVFQLQQPQEIRQRAAEVSCPANGASCEWDVDPSAQAYFYKIVNSATGEVIKEGKEVNPQIATLEVGQNYELRYSCSATNVQVYWVKPGTDASANYKFILYDVTGNPGGTEVGEIPSVLSTNGGAGSIFNGKGTTTPFTPESGKQYQISMFPAGTNNEIARTVAFSCPPPVQKITVPFTAQANNTYRCEVAAVNQCGDYTSMVEQLCSVAIPSNTPTPVISDTPTPTEPEISVTPSVTPLVTPTVTPTISPTPTVLLTPTPTVPPSATPIPSPTPTVVIVPSATPTTPIAIIPSPTPIPQVPQAPQVIPSPTPTLAPAGDGVTTIGIFVGGIILSILGGLLFFTL